MLVLFINEITLVFQRHAECGKLTWSTPAQKTNCLASMSLGWLDSIFHTLSTSGTEEIKVHCAVVSRVGQPVLLLNI